jgi:hypothetical protein
MLFEIYLVIVNKKASPVWEGSIILGYKTINHLPLAGTAS